MTRIREPDDLPASSRETPAGLLDLSTHESEVQIGIRRRLGFLKRWQATFLYKGHNPNFTGLWRWSTLWKAKRHLNRLRRIYRIPEESIWS